MQPLFSSVVINMGNEDTQTLGTAPTSTKIYVLGMLIVCNSSYSVSSRGYFTISQTGGGEDIFPSADYLSFATPGVMSYVPVTSGMLPVDAGQSIQLVKSGISDGDYSDVTVTLFGYAESTL